MAEKIVQLGVSREKDYMYYVTDGGVWKVRQARRGVPKGVPEEVVDGGFEMDTDYIYFVDEDGDVSREAKTESPRRAAEPKPKPVSSHKLTSKNGNGNAVTLALTVHQPWAALIAAGRKTIENRSWDRRSILGTRIAIHAGKMQDDNIDLNEIPAAARKIARAPQPLGAIVCTAVVTGFVTSSDSPWFFGPIGWELADVRPWEPIYCSGSQRLWTLPPDVAAQLATELQPAASR